MISSRMRKILDQLFLMAQDVAPVSKSRIVACLVHKNKIIAYGVNQNKTHPMAAHYGIRPDAQTLHAEISCMRNAINKYGPDILSKCTLVVARAKSSDPVGEYHWGMAKPCKGCEAAVVEFGIKQVIYTTNSHGHVGICRY